MDIRLGMLWLQETMYLTNVNEMKAKFIYLTEQGVWGRQLDVIIHNATKYPSKLPLSFCPAISDVA